MKKFISNLRNKPEHVQKRFALGVTVVCGLILVAFWISTLGSQFRPVGADGSGLKRDLAPFYMIKDGIGSAFKR